MYGPRNGFPPGKPADEQAQRVGRNAVQTATTEVEYLNQGKQLPSSTEEHTTEVPTEGRQPGQTQLVLKHHRAENPAIPSRSWSAAVKEKMHTRKRKKIPVNNEAFEIEFINDSGAGRCVFSEKALRDQGISPKA